MKVFGKRFSDDESGSATVEFVVLFIPFISLVFAVFEAGWLMTRYMMLDRGMDVAVRELRLNIGDLADPTQDKVRDRICEAALILPDCQTTLIVELKKLDMAAAYPKNSPDCFDRAEDAVNPKKGIDPNDELRSEIMFVRACVLVDPIFPGLEFGLLLPKDANGAHQMVTFSAFMNEPL
ncbi:MAG: TadE/TadG family type IV pilus assembly protein [Pseudomonadota bacterium]